MVKLTFPVRAHDKNVHIIFNNVRNFLFPAFFWYYTINQPCTFNFFFTFLVTFKGYFSFSVIK